MSSRHVPGLADTDRRREPRQPVWKDPPPPPEKAAPMIISEALITEAVLQQLRQIKIATHNRVKKFLIKPDFSIADDSKLIGAEVQITLSLMFAAEDE